jgi:hypothetical protein
MPYAPLISVTSVLIEIFDEAKIALWSWAAREKDTPQLLFLGHYFIWGMGVASHLGQWVSQPGR